MDNFWTSMHGGYRIPYDPRPAIAELARDSANENAWNELFENLHHQGDLGEASYASIPILVDTFQNKSRPWRFYCLVSIVEAERHRKSNPAIPDWLDSSYTNSIQEAKELALLDLKTGADEETTRCAIAVIALAYDLVALGKVIAHADEEELEQFAANF